MGISQKEEADDVITQPEKNKRPSLKKKIPQGHVTKFRNQSLILPDFWFFKNSFFFSEAKWATRKIIFENYKKKTRTEDFGGQFFLDTA